MSTMNLHSNTPQLRVIDPRMLSIREVAYCRSDQGTEPDERITRRAWDVAARAVADWDPRLWSAGLSANTAVIHSLSGQALLEENVDAGWRLNLPGADGQVQEYWDQRGSHGRTAYDDLLRPVSVTQTLLGAVPLVVERLLYGDASASCGTHNQCGRLIRHDDPAGTLHTLEFGLTGAVLIENRHFLQSLQLPDWPTDPSQRDELLEPGEGHTTSSLFDATATPVSQTDAVGNSQMHRYTVDGQLKETSLQLAERTSVHALVSNINYNSFGQVESERLGNGVVTENSYEPETGRLTQLKASKPDRPVLQHLTYRYDPLGNILSIEDLALSRTAARNVDADPVSRYRYDSLYQLIEASGREVKVGASHGPMLPELQNLPLDPNQLSNYTQTYNYDAGGNLLQMRHVGEQSFTRTMLIAANSNRSLPEDETDADFDNGFDANGNLRQLLRGQSMSWDQRNQLSLITPVSREDSLNDEEIYSYDAGGQRCRKTRRAMASGRTLLSEVRYLPGLEIRSEPNGEILYVACAQAGRSNVRILHWQANKPDGIDNDQVRYNFADHLGSSALELDGQGALISHEGYYPFAGTAWWTARSAVEAKYKTVRYSGKERDASGLYYYGFRYYAPWLMRWLNPDPAGGLDGINRYVFVGNSPIARIDVRGMEGIPVNIERKLRAWYAASKFPIKVRRLNENVISVSIKGDNSVFAQVGINLDRNAKAPRELTYVVLPPSLRGKVSGGDASIKLATASGTEIAAASRVKPTAYINGGYFNMGRVKPNELAPEHASVGENFIDGQTKPSVLPPPEYASRYSKLTLSDESFIHAAPRLTMNGIPQFAREDSLKPENLYSEATEHVGALGHAGDPNARSGISLAENATANTRLAVALNPGRGTFLNKTDEPGFTMLELTAVFARLDNLNDKNEAGLPAASSWNLDGGDSSTLGVLDDMGNHLLNVNTLKMGARGTKPARAVGNFLSFH
jgi:insecticidal toxin complex protein TccC